MQIKLTSNRLFPGKQGYLAELDVHIWDDCCTTNMFPKNKEKLRKNVFSLTKYLHIRKICDEKIINNLKKKHEISKFSKNQCENQAF